MNSQSWQFDFLYDRKQLNPIDSGVFALAILMEMATNKTIFSSLATFDIR